MAKAAYPTIGIAALVMFGIVYFIGCLQKNDVKHIFFVAETKGSMSSMDLSAIERAKIDCAEKLFNSISTANVKYHKVATYQDLIDGMNAIG